MKHIDSSEDSLVRGSNPYLSLASNDAVRRQKLLTSNTAQATTASEAEGAWSSPSSRSPHAHR